MVQGSRGSWRRNYSRYLFVGIVLVLVKENSSCDGMCCKLSLKCIDRNGMVDQNTLFDSLIPVWKNCSTVLNFYLVLAVPS